MVVGPAVRESQDVADILAVHWGVTLASSLHTHNLDIWTSFPKLVATIDPPSLEPLPFLENGARLLDIMNLACTILFPEHRPQAHAGFYCQLGCLSVGGDLSYH